MKKLTQKIIALAMAATCSVSAAAVSASAAGISSLAKDSLESAVSKGADVVNAQSADGYWSKNLSRNGQTAYCKIVDALTKFQDSVTLSNNLDSKELAEIPQIIQQEHPEIFYVDILNSKPAKAKNENGFVVSYIYNFKYMSNARQKVSDVESAANKILANAPKSGSDYDKELYVHDQLRNLVSYKVGENNIYNSLVEHKGSCMGYSLAMQYLLNKLGVTCRVQTGVATNPKGNKEDHMWNIVTLNGKEYLVDVTWDDVLVNGYNYAPYRYFNVTKDMMSETHTPKNASEWSKCTNTDQDWYRKNGFYFNSWDEVMKAMPTMIAKQGGDKGNPVSFRLPSTKMANEISSHITGGTAGSMNDLTGGKAIYTSKKGTLGATGFRY